VLEAVETLAFKSSAALSALEHHTGSEGVWLRFHVSVRIRGGEKRVERSPVFPRLRRIPGELIDLIRLGRLIDVGAAGKGREDAGEDDHGKDGFGDARLRRGLEAVRVHGERRRKNSGSRLRGRAWSRSKLVLAQDANPFEGVAGEGEGDAEADITNVF
jgi:hypothetical protein